MIHLTATRCSSFFFYDVLVLKRLVQKLQSTAKNITLEYSTLLLCSSCRSKSYLVNKKSFVTAYTGLGMDTPKSKEIIDI